MRNKKAKQLKRQAKKYSAGVDWVNYENTNQRHKMYFNWATGMMQPMFVATTMLGSCQKAMYKQFKASYKAAKQGLQKEIVI